MWRIILRNFSKVWNIFSLDCFGQQELPGNDRRKKNGHDFVNHGRGPYVYQTYTQQLKRLWSCFQMHIWQKIEICIISQQFNILLAGYFSCSSVHWLRRQWGRRRLANYSTMKTDRTEKSRSILHAQCDVVTQSICVAHNSTTNHSQLSWRQWCKANWARHERFDEGRKVDIPAVSSAEESGQLSTNLIMCNDY